MPGRGVLGGREIGDVCPACYWPTDAPPAKEGEFPVVADIAPPSTATWTCPHCGFEITAAYHGEDNLTPRPGHP